MVSGEQFNAKCGQLGLVDQNQMTYVEAESVEEVEQSILIYTYGEDDDIALCRFHNGRIALSYTHGFEDWRVDHWMSDEDFNGLTEQKIQLIAIVLRNMNKRIAPIKEQIEQEAAHGYASVQALINPNIKGQFMFHITDLGEREVSIILAALDEHANEPDNDHAVESDAIWDKIYQQVDDQGYSQLDEVEIEG